MAVELFVHFKGPVGMDLRSICCWQGLVKQAELLPKRAQGNDSHFVQALVVAKGWQQPPQKNQKNPGWPEGLL